MIYHKKHFPKLNIFHGYDQVQKAQQVLLSQDLLDTFVETSLTRKMTKYFNAGKGMESFTVNNTPTSASMFSAYIGNDVLLK